MASIAHIVNPFSAAEGSEWAWVQALTWASMHMAHQQAIQGGLAVELCAVHFAEDKAAVPEGFRSLPPLNRSVRDLPGLEAKPPLPFIADIWQLAYEHTDADYLIFTNADICLQPHFYTAVAQYIAAGHDAFFINRRRIPGNYRKVEDLPKMYAEKGKPHPGFDCFVLHRDLIPQMQLGNICLGIPFIEITMGQNVFALAKTFKLFDREHLTFHIGEDVFKPRDPDLLAHNRTEFRRIIRSLWPILDSRKWPYDHWFPLVRWIRWGLHPCLPIRVGLMLEGKRWGKRN